jgi:hypothetical protein
MALSTHQLLEKNITVSLLSIPRNIRTYSPSRPIFAQFTGESGWVYIDFNIKMKPLKEMNLNKCSIVTTAQEDKTGKPKRPALELLNILNNKLVEENHVTMYRKEMEGLKKENQQLKTMNEDLMKEL